MTENNIGHDSNAWHANWIHLPKKNGKNENQIWGDKMWSLNFYLQYSNNEDLKLKFG